MKMEGVDTEARGTPVEVMLIRSGSGPPVVVDRGEHKISSGVFSPPSQSHPLRFSGSQYEVWKKRYVSLVVEWHVVIVQD